MKMSIKKIMSSVLALLILLSAVSVCVVTASTVPVTSGDYSYTLLVSGTAEIINYNGSETNLVIPSNIDGYTVTNIGLRAFYNCSDLNSIVIPDSVINIANSAFENCENLESITIPDSVINIGTKAFANTAWYKNQPEGLVYAGKVLYEYKGTVPENASITLEEGTKGIASYAFEYCDNLKSITIPDSVTYIGAYAFSDCHGLTGIELPCNLTKISYGTFSGCSKLEGITIPDSVTSIDIEAFEWCNNLKSIEIPQSVTSIGTDAFKECTGLESITIPDSVTSIGNRVFYNCKSLANATIGDGVVNIGKEAFRFCDNLTKLTIGKSVASIGEWAFANCMSLENIFVSDNNSVYSDADGVLYNKNLMEIVKYPAGKKDTEYVIFDGIESISNEAFYDDKILVSITLPDSFTNLENDVFNYSENLENLYVSKNNDVFSDVDGVLYNKTLTEAVRYPMGKKYTEYTVPDGVIKIRTYAFSNCKNLENITIPHSVENVGINAFDKTAWYENLPDGLIYVGKAVYKYKGYLSVDNSVIIEEGTKSITDDAFRSLDGLKNITIPSSVTSIGNNAFYGCTSLTSITIPDSITNINAGTFSFCTSLKSVTIPDSVINIGDNAFSWCSGLESVTIPNSVKSIEAYAFLECTNIKNIKIPESVIEIKDFALGYCQTEHFEYKMQDFSITGYDNTAAEAYAKANEIEFIQLFKIYGDADGDGEVTVKDATYIQLYLAKMLGQNIIDLTVCNVDNDGQTTVKDVTYIQLYCASLQAEGNQTGKYKDEPKIEPTAPETEQPTQPETQPTTGTVPLPDYTQPITVAG